MSDKPFDRNKNIERYSNELLPGIAQIIENSRKKVAVTVLSESTIMYWSIGDYINVHFKKNNRAKYGSKILATVSQQLTGQFGKGFTYTALTRMCKVASTYSKETIATLSQQLSWSHLIELAAIEDVLKREFYAQMSIVEKWGVRDLRNQIDKMLFERTSIAKQPETVIREELGELKTGQNISPELVFKNTYVLDFLNLPGNYSERELENALVQQIEHFLLELGTGFAFVERQKRISIDSEDYHLDLLFYHRKLKRLVAIDLKLGKFKPKHKAQMELYLRWLIKHEMQPGEQKPIGLLLCSEGNTEHIELLMLDEKQIKVAQYLTELPSKAWFADKLHRAMQIAKQNTNEHD